MVCLAERNTRTGPQKCQILLRIYAKLVCICFSKGDDRCSWPWLVDLNLPRTFFILYAGTATCTDFSRVLTITIFTTPASFSTGPSAVTRSDLPRNDSIKSAGHISFHALTRKTTTYRQGAFRLNSILWLLLANGPDERQWACFSFDLYLTGADISSYYKAYDIPFCRWFYIAQQKAKNSPNKDVFAPTLYLYNTDPPHRINGLNITFLIDFPSTDLAAYTACYKIWRRKTYVFLMAR